MTCLLILTANPANTQPLRLSEEVREIKAAWERSHNRDQFQIHIEGALRPKELRRSLLRYQPDIIHFSGHGGGEHGLAVLNDTGEALLVKSQALARLFRALQRQFQIQCVVLNACYSEDQAQAIAPYANYVVGMQQKIGDRAAREFAIGFYDGLFAGAPIDSAFDLGCNAIELENLPEQLTPMLHQRQQQREPQNTGRKLFISYKRDAEPDEAVALQIYEALRPAHQVFIDQTMLVGTPWLERITTEIQQADFLIVLLSAASVHSEMVQAELEIARAQAAKTPGRPQILPVRLAYQEPFPYPMNIYLDAIHWAFWEPGRELEGLITELQAAIAGRKLPLNTNQQKQSILQASPKSTLPMPLPAAALEMPEGTMDVESKFYVERAPDPIALATIQQPGVTITIKGPRQMGKSSLLLRVMDAAVNAGKQVVFLDFQLFGQAALQDSELFYRQFCTMLTDELDLEDELETFWRPALGHSQNCTRYLSRYVLKTVKAPLVLVMDEVDKLFGAAFRSDFFSMLRGWHNSRAIRPDWKRLDLALVTSTEPYQLIADLNQSPFNVGQVLELTDFKLAQVGDLNGRHGQPLNERACQQLYRLLGGHPYLVRRALYVVASSQLTVSELFAQATDDRGPFGDHLRYHLFRLYDQQALVQCLLQIIRGKGCPNEHDFFRLRGAGLVRREEGSQRVQPRCELYGRYFHKRLSQV
ncbi:MAG: TIR domain-containing protein [Spirulina sp. SIO3F2]|nr:TIR domain-containing protein [Spirulina sp. SIO3F2]